MDELAMLRGKLADLESKLEQASERKMPSVTNEWIVTECNKSINKIDRARQLYIDTNKIRLSAVEERIMECKLLIPTNESIMTPLARAIQSNPKGPWRVLYRLWDNSSIGLNVPNAAGEEPFRCEFVKRMVSKYHADMLKTTFPTATWDCTGNETIDIWVTFPQPIDSMDEYKSPLLS